MIKHEDPLLELVASDLPVADMTILLEAIRILIDKTAAIEKRLVSLEQSRETYLQSRV